MYTLREKKMAKTSIMKPGLLVTGLLWVSWLNTFLEIQTFLNSEHYNTAFKYSVLFMIISEKFELVDRLLEVLFSP